jgi:hypothetical protein
MLNSFAEVLFNITAENGPVYPMSTICHTNPSPNRGLDQHQMCLEAMEYLHVSRMGGAGWREPRDLVTAHEEQTQDYFY